MTRRLVGLPVVLALCACSGGGTEPAFLSVVEDGTTRAVTQRPEWLEVRPLRVTSLSRFESQEDDGVLLTRVVGAVLLSDGGVAVLDERSSQLIDFSESGEVRRVLGGLGDGPGEFRRPRTLSLLPGDSLAVYDSRANRITMFGPTGDPTVRSLGELIMPPALDVWQRPYGVVVSFEGNRRDATPLARGPDGHTVGALAVVTRTDLRGETRDTLHSEGVAVEMLIRGDMLLPLPFPRLTWVDVQDDLVAISPSDGFRVRRVRATGEVLEAEMPSGQVLLAQGEVDRLRDSIRALTVEAGAAFVNEAAFHPALQPESRPSFGAVRVAPDGRMLARVFEPLGSRSRTWWLISEDGRFRGRVQVPEDVEVLRFLGDRLLWVRRDELDVPAVELVEVDWVATLDG